MSDTVKLIIEIPKISYDVTLDMGRLAAIRDNDIYNMLANATPLDDVKADIVDKAIKDASGEGFIFLGRLLRIFDNIGKAESEGK